DFDLDLSVGRCQRAEQQSEREIEEAHDRACAAWVVPTASARNVWNKRASRATERRRWSRNAPALRSGRTRRAGCPAARRRSAMAAVRARARPGGPARAAPG